jgi:hypothetical protein
MISGPSILIFSTYIFYKIAKKAKHKNKICLSDI